MATDLIEINPDQPAPDVVDRAARADLHQALPEKGERRNTIDHILNGLVDRHRPSIDLFERAAQWNNRTAVIDATGLELSADEYVASLGALPAR